MKNSKWMKITYISLNVILYLLAILLWIAIPEEKGLNISVSVISLLLTLILGYFYQNTFKKIASGSYFRNLTGTCFTVFLVFSILALMNYLGVKNDMSYDLTKDKRNTLTKQSLGILNSVDDHLKFTIVSPRKVMPAISALLQRYKTQNKFISIDYVDPDLRPEYAQKYNIQKLGVVLATYKERWVKIKILNEISITNGLIQLVRNKRPIIYATTGHGELDLSQAGPTGGSHLLKELEQSHYDVKIVNLAMIKELPKDLNLLMILGAKTHFLPEELNLLEQYMKNDGNLLVTVMPLFNESETLNFVPLLKNRGIQVSNNLVIDKKSYIRGSSGSVPLITNLNARPEIITKVNGPVFFPLVSEVKKWNDYKGEYKVKEILKTSPHPFSFAKKLFKDIGDANWEFNKEYDQEGPINLLVKSNKVAGDKAKARTIVLGNTTLVENRYAGQGKNFNFFLNAVYWSVNDDFLIALDRPNLTPRKIIISRPQNGVIFYFSIIVGPLLLLILSGIFYIRRRAL